MKDKQEKINSLILIVREMEELWIHHPKNPNKINVIREYERLEKIREELENEIDGV